MPLSKARKRADTKEQTRKIVRDVLSRNGKQDSGDFSNKEVYLLLLDSIDKKIDEQGKKIAQHLKDNQEAVDKYLPEFHRLQEEFIQVCKELPDKGFCGKVDKMYNDLYPEGESPLHEKVNTLWYDRKILKWIVGLCVGTFITGIITLGVGFLKGVF